MVYVYGIVSLVRNYIYVGMTNDPERRIFEHNNKENRSTKAYAPFELIFLGEYETRIEAHLVNSADDIRDDNRFNKRKPFKQISPDFGA
mgnify:CR=1 FL=1